MRPFIAALRAAFYAGFSPSTGEAPLTDAELRDFIALARAMRRYLSQWIGVLEQMEARRAHERRVA